MIEMMRKTNYHTVILYERIGQDLHMLGVKFMDDEHLQELISGGACLLSGKSKVLRLLLN